MEKVLMANDWKHLPEVHRAFLERALLIWGADPRIVGIAAGGSMISGLVDAYSDLDLVIVCTDEARASIASHRDAIARAAGNLLQAFTGEHVGEPRLLICLYGPPLLHVDLKFISFGEFHVRIEDPILLFDRDQSLARVVASTKPKAWPTFEPQWTEDRFWIWIHYVAEKIRRGELFEAVDAFALWRPRVFAPMIAHVEQIPLRGVRRFEMIAGNWVEKLSRITPHATKAECIASLHASIDLYSELRERLPSPPRPSHAETTVRKHVVQFLPLSQGEP